LSNIPVFYSPTFFFLHKDMIAAFIHQVLAEFQRPQLQPLHMGPETSELLSNNAPLPGFSLPFEDIMGRQLSQSLDIGINFGQNAASLIPEESTRLILGFLGTDVLIFLAASVVVTTIGRQRFENITHPWLFDHWSDPSWSEWTGYFFKCRCWS
jgi:hypothetical protein